jgi:hypothetical protein
LIGVRRVRFQTDSFAGVFSTKHKPSAHIFTLMREDFEHLIKFGTTLHGEVFCTGVRLRRADGKSHITPLPHGPLTRKDGLPDASWTLRDAEEGEFLATFPELKVNFVVTDGAMSQVQSFFKLMYCTLPPPFSLPPFSLPPPPLSSLNLFTFPIFAVQFAQEPRDNRDSPHWADRCDSGDRHRGTGPRQAR